MNRLSLVFPTLELKEKALDYREEHFKNGEMAIHGDGGLDNAESYEGWIKKINEDLWVVEDQLRIKEKNNQFDESFISLARSVYYHNDERAKIKREINKKYGSSIIEEKFYEKY